MKILLVLAAIIGAAIYFGKKWMDKSWDEDQKKIDDLEAQYKVSKEKLRLLAFGAIMPYDDHDTTRVLMSIKSKEDLAKGLQEYWGISNNKSAKAKLEQLLTSGSGREANELLQELRRYKDYDEFAEANPAEVASEEGKDFHEKFYSATKELVEKNKEVPTIRFDKTAPKIELPIDEKTINNIKSLNAWDYGRVVSVCKLCYSIGYLNEDEAWEYITKAANKAASEYSSWQEYALSYILGRFLAYEANIHALAWTTYTLIAGKDQIWHEIDIKK